MQSPGKDARPVGSAAPYERHRPETTRLYPLVEAHYPVFVAQLATRGTPLPEYVQREFTDYLRCGRLEHGFLRVRCESCHAERLVAFSCKRRGFCPSCGARRMAESAALLVDEVLPAVPMRQWVLSFPFPLRFLFASRPKIMGKVLAIVYRVLATHLIHKAGFTHATARTGAVTLILPTNDRHPVKRVNYATEVNHDSKDKNEEDNPAAALSRIPGGGAGFGGESGHSRGGPGSSSCMTRNSTAGGRRPRRSEIKAILSKVSRQRMRG